MSDMLLSLRTWLVIKAMEQGATFPEASDAVAETMKQIKDPDPNLRTYKQWNDRYKEVER